MEQIIELNRSIGKVESSVASLERGQSSITADLNSKHRENRNDIHDLRDKMQTFVDALTLQLNTRLGEIEKRLGRIEVKIAVGCAIGGLLFSFAQEGVKMLLEHFVK